MVMMMTDLTDHEMPRVLRIGSCIDRASGRDTGQAPSTLRSKGLGVLG